MEKKAKQIDDAASKSATDCALAIVGSLAYTTPVDTSKALSNWLVSVGAPSLHQVGPHYPGKQGSSQRSSASEVLTAAKQALKAKKPGQTIYITNNLIYISILNGGSSEQAAAGFVERAVLIGKRQLKFKLDDVIK